MFGIILSAINTFAGWLVKSVLVKFGVMFALFYVAQELVPILAALLPDVGVVQSVVSNVPSSVAYFLDLFRFDYGLSLVLSAYATRFMIRRLPVIG